MIRYRTAAARMPGRWSSATQALSTWCAAHTKGGAPSGRPLCTKDCHQHACSPEG